MIMSLIIIIKIFLILTIIPNEFYYFLYKLKRQNSKMLQFNNNLFNDLLDKTKKENKSIGKKKKKCDLIEEVQTLQGINGVEVETGKRLKRETVGSLKKIIEDFSIKSPDVKIEKKEDVKIDNGLSKEDVEMEVEEEVKPVPTIAERNHRIKQAGVFLTRMNIKFAKGIEVMSNTFPKSPFGIEGYAAAIEKDAEIFFEVYGDLYAEHQDVFDWLLSPMTKIFLLNYMAIMSCKTIMKKKKEKPKEQRQDF